MTTDEMTETQFYGAWNNTPPTRVVYSLLQKDCIIRVERPLDSAWHFSGNVQGTGLDYMVSCGCKFKAVQLKWKPGAPVPAEGRAVAICCRGGRFLGDGWYFIGQCPECKLVYWFRR